MLMHASLLIKFTEQPFALVKADVQVKDVGRDRYECMC